jgi:hypothetical protein
MMSIVIAAAAALSIPCNAQNGCPWLNVATASGVLGGPAAVTVSKTSETTGTCVFKAQAGSRYDLLTISVASAIQGQDVSSRLGRYEDRCTSPRSPLRAIGNEAVLCANDDSKSHREQVVGRVRDNIFTVDLSTSVRSASIAKDDPLAENAKAIAEQVAGILF